MNGSTLTSSTNFLNIASDTTALAQESFQLALLNLGLSVVGAQVQVTAGEALLSGTFFMVNITEMAGLMNITNWNGMVLDAHQGLHADNHAGLHIDNHSGIHMDLHSGSHMSFDSGIEIKELTGAQMHQVLGPHCHMLTQAIRITDATQIEVASTYMRL